MNDGPTPNPCQQYQDAMSTVAGGLSDGFKSKMDAIVSKYKPVFDEIEDDSPNPGTVGGTLNIDFDVTWKDVSIKFDLPEVTMTLQKWNFDVPQVTMKQQEIIFHTPSTRMGTQKVGQYPEFHGFTVVWKDILIDVPEFFMQEQKIVMGIPEFKMDTTSIELHVPEFTMKTEEIILGLPQFTLKSVTGEVHNIQERADATKSSMDEDIARERYVSPRC
jgi:hypothetical protein